MATDARPPVKRMRTAMAALQLARWLGPWGDAKVPTTVTRTTTTVLGRTPFRAHLYVHARHAPIGAYLVAPGLHFLGPNDPRFDRFCRILAAAGLLVLAPFLPSHLALRVSPESTDDLAASFEHLERIARGLPPPAIFSISFGSQPALALAARPAFRDRISALVLFGGFADFDATVRYAITGHATHRGRTLSIAHDPLNAPVVWLNLLPHLAQRAEVAPVARAWRAFVERTWGRPEFKIGDARAKVANGLAGGLGARERELFLMGCGLVPGALPLVEEALAAAGGAFDFTDPRPHLAALGTPLAIVHGRDDDVVPWFEAEKLRDALPAGHPHRLLVTGMYGHTGSSIATAASAAGEARTMMEVLRTMVAAPVHGIRAFT
jgi:pimeloyl-ACP methyl ester carboxylesterase